MTSQPTPKQAGYHMPAEWEPHERTWMMWPCRAEVWTDMEETRRNYAAVAHAIRNFEPLTMLVRPGDVAAARSMLGGDIDILDHPIDDSWARDAGPCFLVNDAGDRAGVSFRFNAWGGKYAPYEGDNSAADAVMDAAGVRSFAYTLIAEGGGVSVDGKGTILTKDSCFPNANRNQDWNRDQIERELMEMLGGTKVIWLPGNVEETETYGQVDGTAVFIAPGLVLIEAEGAPDHPWRAIKRANIDAMRGQTDATGHPIKLIMMEEASGKLSDDDDMFCRSYVNSYLGNGGVIMLEYGVAEAAAARETFEEYLPGRRVVSAHVEAIAIGGGGIHCITQQEPQAP